jgi:hypothetical protein
MVQVFISFAEEDRSEAEDVRVSLDAAGIKCKITTHRISYYRKWIFLDDIWEAMTSAEMLIVIWSAAAGASPQVRSDIEFALQSYSFVILFCIEDVPNFSFQAIDFLRIDTFRPPYFDAGLARLVAEVQARLLPIVDANALPMQSPEPPVPPGFTIPELLYARVTEATARTTLSRQEIAARGLTQRVPRDAAQRLGLYLRSRWVVTLSWVIAAIPAIGKFFRAETSALPASREINDLVDLSAFAPEGGAGGTEILVQAFLHGLSDLSIAEERAREADPDTRRHGVATLVTEIPRGTHVDILIGGRDLTVDEPLQTVIWRGRPCACQYLVTLPNTPIERTCNLRVTVLLDGAPVGSLRFALKVFSAVPAEAMADLRIRGDTASRYRRAFLSYATPDRPEVLKRAQALRASHIDFFQDFLSIGPGERWERRLYEEIDHCDLFLLFWSKSAAQSEWVLREAELAVARQNASPNEQPDIAPIILEGPPVPQPIPDSLKHLQFNDYLLYWMAAQQEPSAIGPSESRRGGS